MLCLFLTFLHLSDCLISVVGVLSLLFWWVAWWWYHCRTRHPWSWWPNPGPSSKYKIKIQIFSRSLLCSPRPSWRCPAPWLGRRPTAGGTQPRLSQCAPGPVQYSTLHTVQYSTAPGPTRTWSWQTAPWWHSQLQAVAGMFAKSRWHL